MSRAILALIAVVCITQTAARPVRRTLNFNMFVLQPKQGATDRVLLTTDGVSRFGPLLEYLVQRVQGMMSIRNPQEPSISADIPVASQVGPVPIADASENEVDSVQPSRMPGIVVKPSQNKPGTFEVEINVVVDDGQPDDMNKSR